MLRSEESGPVFQAKGFEDLPPSEGRSSGGRRKALQAPAAGSVGQGCASLGLTGLQGRDGWQGTDKAVHGGHKTKFIFNL